MASTETEKSDKEGWFEDTWLDVNGIPLVEASHLSPNKMSKMDSSPTSIPSPSSEHGHWNRMFAIGKKILEKAREGNLTAGFDASNASSSPPSPSTVFVPLLPKPHVSEKDSKLNPSTYEPPYYWSEEDEEDDDDDEEEDERESEHNYLASSAQSNSISTKKQSSQIFYLNSSNDDLTLFDSIQSNKISMKSREMSSIPKSESFESRRSLEEDENSNNENEKEKSSKHFDSCGWKQIALEVIPVLGIVAIAVLGTFFYYYIKGKGSGLFPEEREKFSLSCQVGSGEWIESQEKNDYYPSSCPFLRDKWNCKKFALSKKKPTVQFRWIPNGCLLPPFQPHPLLSVLAGKRLAFIGDKSAANEFESLVCMLAKAERPKLVDDDLLFQYSSDSQRPKSKSTSNSNVNVDGDSDRHRNALAGDLNGMFGWKGFGNGGRKESAFMRDGKEGEERAEERRERKEDREEGEKSDGEELYWKGKREKLTYLFPSYNFTLTLFDSPLLVNISNYEKVNRTNCQISKARLAHLSTLMAAIDFDSHLITNANDKDGDVESAISKVSMRKVKHGQTSRAQVPKLIPNDAFIRSNEAKRNPRTSSRPGSVFENERPTENDGSGENSRTETPDDLHAPERTSEEEVLTKEQLQSKLSDANLAVYDSCYPNRIVLDMPDYAWSNHVNDYDVVVLNSGREWREEVMEKEGISIFNGSKREEGMSLEGLSGEWAYPHAVKNIVSWLNDENNYDGHVIFRSYASTHMRKECAERVILNGVDDQAIKSSLVDDFQVYDDAAMDSLKDTKFTFLNVSLLSARRADGHPWTSYSVQPKPDCSHWCLPGVPDTWNEILSATLMEIYGGQDGSSM